MNRTIILTFLAAIVTTNIACKKDNVITPLSWDLSGKIVFNPISGNGENRGIFILDMNSSTLFLTTLVGQGIEPRVNPNGTEVAYTGTQSGMIDIFRINISGGTAIDLTPDSSVTDSWPDWSPDGSSIVFNRVIYHPTIKEALFVVNRDGSNLHLVTDTASLQTSVMPRWSPDGSTITFIGRVSANPPYIHSLYTIARDGSHQVLLDQIGPIFGMPLWSPDAERIAYGKTGQALYDTTAHQYVDTTAGLYVVNIANKGSQKIGFGTMKITGEGFSWLPDGRLICVGKDDNDTTNSYGIYLVSTSNSLNWKLLAKGFRSLPTTTPSSDGKYVAIFGTANNDSTFGLYVVGSDGTNFRKLKDVDSSPSAFIDDYYCQWVIL